MADVTHEILICELANWICHAHGREIILMLGCAFKLSDL